MCFCLDHDGEVHVYTAVEENEVGETVGYVLLSEDLYGISGGEAVAILLNLEVSEGWSMEKITGTPDTDGMQVTAAFSDGDRRAAVLLDGYPVEAAGDSSILAVKLVREGETHCPCLFTVSRGQYGGEAIYYRNGLGEICTQPLHFETPKPSETEEVTAPCSETKGGSMQETPTEPTVETGTVEAPSVNSGNGEPPTGSLREPSFAFVGCRETPARDGTFAVQILFAGDTAYTPVVCFSGGSGLLLELTEADAREIFGGDMNEFFDTNNKNRLYACTFWGLSAEGETVFFVSTPKGVVRIAYQNGIFLGYFPITYAK